jgi:hypothetical protein
MENHSTQAEITPQLNMENKSSQPGTIASTHDETDVESAPEPEVQEKFTDKDPNLVEWDGPDDPENPQNFSNLRKWIITLTMSSMTMWITFASSVFSTATQVTAKEFNVSTEVMVLGTSLVVFGFALGPLCWAPLSELYGRRIPLFSGYAIFAIFQIPVAVAQNLETVLVCRFLMGVFGCSPLAVVGGAMADIWNPVDRAVAIALFSSATFLGPVMGPIMYVINRLLLLLYPEHQILTPSQWRFYHRLTPRLALDSLDNPNRLRLFRPCGPLRRPRDLRPSPPPTARSPPTHRNP